MIKTVKISNFKSVQELEIELGRLNVFIGENGCGKTSILEGIAMGSAAAEGRLEEEFLFSRGIRVTEHKFMTSAFQANNSSDILVGFNNHPAYKIQFLMGPLFQFKQQWVTVDENGIVLKRNVVEGFKWLLETVKPVLTEEDKSSEGFKNLETKLGLLEQLANEDPSLNFPSFLLFAPENFFLRRFEEEGQIRPLGIRGEGLFRHLVELSKEAPETFTKIAEHLSLIDWFGGMSIPNNLQFTERRIAITDRFIADTIQEFDQRSANEGFLYLLFYFTLFLSKYTPKFFAIDNIDNALNPRLCAKLVAVLAQIAKDEDKQAILTTHNPAVLDGLDLNDDEQRLFVIYRNEDGETKARRVEAPKKIKGVTPVRLSEAFVRGYLGGLPTNF